MIIKEQVNLIANIRRKVIDYNVHIEYTSLFKMLQEIERTVAGKKLISLLFRVYIVLFSKRKLKDIID